MLCNKCCAVLCCAMPCHAMPCHAMPCHAVPCCAVPCHAVPCHVMPCRAIHTAAPLLVSVALSLVFYTLYIGRPLEMVVTLQTHVFVVILTQTKVGHWACIIHNIQINIQNLINNFFHRGLIHFRTDLQIALQLK